MLRLTGGEFRGRMIQTPASVHTRPTQARLRQALLNSLQTVIPDANVLDLFAGSGALGLEALSRGAERVTFVENHRDALKALEANIGLLAVKNRVEIIAEPVERSWKRVLHAGPYDVVFADPPYSGGWELKLLNEAPWEGILKPGGRFCLEWGRVKSRIEEDSLPERVAFLVKTREKNYGDAILSTYEREHA